MTRTLAMLLLLASPAFAADDCDDLRKMERSFSSTRTDELIAKYGIPQTEGDKLVAAQMRADRAPALADLRERLKTCSHDKAGSAR